VVGTEMMWESEIEDVCRRLTLPAKLVHAIVQTESSGDPWAYRYEPAFYKNYIHNKPFKTFGFLSVETEMNGLATSWGLMQVMGVVARERGYTRAYLSELCKPEYGLEYGCRQLKNLENRFMDGYGWNGVIAAYNAGSPRRDQTGAFLNQSYVTKVRNLWGD
jgi:soluble lytic murein transglycosylase-like protein